MFKFAGAAVSLLLASSNAFAAAACDFAGQTYSEGATVCECPSLSGEGGLATGGQAKVRSRRLACSSEGWKDAGSTCIEITYARSSASALEDFTRFNDQYCPRLPVNYGEIQKALKQESAKFIDTAPKATVIFMLEMICKRFKVESSCKVVLDAISGSASDSK
jgi:hypothetical protein